MNDVEQIKEDTSLPLIIGVTGHRNLREEDLSKLEGLVRQLIQKFENDFPISPMTLLSALAEGADRLVAHVALELGAHLVAPLPMPRELYEEDFDTSASRLEFDTLLRKAVDWFDLPLVPGATLESIKVPGASRDLQYEQSGAYIVRRSHLLVALWDGEDRDLVGGTSRIVRFHLEGLPERFATVANRIDTPEKGPVYHIVTPTVSHPKTRDKPFSIRELYPRGHEGDFGVR
jgi:hypothetical protein